MCAHTLWESHRNNNLCKARTAGRIRLWGTNWKLDDEKEFPFFNFDLTWQSVRGLRLGCIGAFCSFLIILDRTSFFFGGKDTSLKAALYKTCLIVSQKRSLLIKSRCTNRDYSQWKRCTFAECFRLDAVFLRPLAFFFSSIIEKR